MIRTKNFRKIISVLLCVSILASLIVSGSVTSKAEPAAGQYTWRVRWVVDDNFDNTSNGSDEASWFTLYGGENNAANGSETKVEKKKIEQNLTSKIDDGTNIYLTNITSGGDIGQSSSVVTYTTSYFPTGFDCNMYKTGHAGFGVAEFTIHLEIRNSSGSWVDICSAHKKFGGGWGGEGWGNMYVSTTAASSYWPAPKTVNFTTAPTATITVPRKDEATVSVQYEATVYDQYGVSWYTGPDYAFVDAHEGISVIQNTGEVTVTSDANSADGSQTNLVLKATKMTHTATVDVKVQNATYNYSFKDADGKEIKAGSLRYGNNVPLPTTPVKQPIESVHYNFKSWSPVPGKLTGDTTFTPEYEEEEHKFKNYVSDGNATCLEDGTETATCTCGYTDTRIEENSALDHDFVETILIEPTCTKFGLAEYNCSRCDESYTAPLNPSAHNYVTSIVEPTCTEQGYTLHTCINENCGKTLKDNYVPALDHNYGEWLQTTDPTCTETGEMTRYCSRCDAFETKEVPANGHSVKNWTLLDGYDCEKEGSRTGVCQVCHQTVYEVIPPTGHSWGSWIDDYSPTCDTPGQHHRVCSECSKVDTQEIEPLGHTYEMGKNEPKNKRAGSYYYHCTVCGIYAACEINEQGEKEPGETAPTKAKAVAASTPIPTTSFNTYNRVESNYNYSTRGAALKVDSSEGTDIQRMRFCASMTVPEGAQIEDIGYVYTQKKLMPTNTSKFVIGGTANVYHQSMINGKRTVFQTAQGEVWTFNLVIPVKLENWTEEYVARPYIIYNFAGETFSVYDDIYTSKSVAYIAQAICASQQESDYNKNFFKSKIIDVLGLSA